MKQALTGGAYQAHSVIASAQRSLNLYAEPMPEAQGEPMPAAHYPTPGLRLIGTIGTGPIRGIRQCTTGGVYVVSGSTVYSVDTSTWAGSALGTITTGLRTPVSMQDNGLDMLIVDGTTNGWDVTLAANTMAQITQTATVISPVTGITGTDPIVQDNGRYTPFVPTVGGMITGATVSLGAGYAGHLKCSVFSAGLGSVLGTAAVITNPATGVNTLSFADTIPVTAGNEYWLGFVSDRSAGAWNRGSVGAPGATSNTLYAAFPVASPDPTPASPLICTITTGNDPDGFFTGADRVDYLDTFFILNKPATPQFYISGSLAVTFDSLDFANKEAYSDLLVVAVVAKRLVYLFGTRTTEIWYDAGASDIGAGSFPFAAMQSEVFIDHGCAAKYSPAVYDNSVFWLTKDRQGQGIVMMVSGYQTKRVSTYAIESEIAGYAMVSDAIGFTYQLAGHSFYVLTFPHQDHTWSYDISTGHWHEWLWIDANGDEHRHRANCFWPVDGTLVVGDWQNGNLYALDRDAFTDNGSPIKRVRSFPHLLADGKRVFYRQFLADMETGWAPEIPVQVIIPPTASGFHALPLTSANTDGGVFAVSADGSTMVGYVVPVGSTLTERQAAYWTAATGPIAIAPDFFSEATGVSADGSVIAGNADASAYRWTAGGGLVALSNDGDVLGISADGSRVVGSTIAGTDACYWNSSGVQTVIGHLPGGAAARATAVCADGSVIVGDDRVSGHTHAWRWMAGTGMVDLGIVGTALDVSATGVSGDGSIVVGDLFTGAGTFRWTAATGMVEIPAATLDGGTVVSGDGSTIVGDQFNPARQMAYLTASGAVVPPAVPLDPAHPTNIQATTPASVSADGTVMAGYTNSDSFNLSLPWVYYVPQPSRITIPVASDNLVSLDWSDDRGHSYGSPVTQPIGAAGEYRTSLQWQRLAYARDRVFRISWSTPMATALQGCWIDATPAQS